MSLLSICIPTRNRADYLDFLLGEIAEFDDLNYEVVLSDNASEDDTPTVAMRWRSELKSLHYFRQSKPVTGAENAYAVCNAARGDYIFRISDDDLVVEEGLLAALQILDRETDCAAVYPRWHICDSTLEEIRTVVHYGADTPLIRNNTDRLEDAEPHPPIQVSLDQALEMYERFWTVELPVFRRALFQDHIGYMSNYMPLDFYAAIKFLQHGDLYFIWDLCAKIRQHSGQDSAALYSPRVLEAYASDYEQFLSRIPGLEPAAAMQAFHAKMIRQYVISSQLAVQAGDFLRALELVRKSLAFRVPGVVEFAQEFDSTHGLSVVAEYIAKAISMAPKMRRLILEDTSYTEELLPILRSRINSVSIEIVSTDQLVELSSSPDELVIAECQITVRERIARSLGNPSRQRSFETIVSACKAL